MADDKETGNSDVPEKIRFNYIKSSAFRTIHADGVIGAVTPRLNITAAFYSERKAIPDQIVSRVIDGKLGDEILEERVGGESMTRELETNVIMDVAFARSLIAWLQDQVNLAEEAMKEALSNAAEQHKAEREVPQ